jgi:hypothetical protein
LYAVYSKIVFVPNNAPRHGGVRETGGIASHIVKRRSKYEYRLLVHTPDTSHRGEGPVAQELGRCLVFGTTLNVVKV